MPKMGASVALDHATFNVPACRRKIETLGLRHLLRWLLTAPLGIARLVDRKIWPLERQIQFADFLLLPLDP